MIFRTYDRRGGGFADGVSDSSSQDVYDFTFQTDPYDFNSSQESSHLAFLPPRKGGGDCDGKFRKPKKLKTMEADSKIYGTKSSQESKRFGDLRISDGKFQKPKKPKKASIDPYDDNSSQELEKFASLPQIEGRESSVFDFTEDGDLWESKKSKNVDSDIYVLNSSQEWCALGVSQSRKRESHWGFDLVSRISKKKDKVEINPDPYGYNSSQEPQRKSKENSVFVFSEDLWESKKSKNVDSDSYLVNSSQELGDLGISQSRKRDWDFGEVSAKPKKKDRGEIGVFQKKKKKKKMKSKESEQGYVELTATLMETQESGEMMEHEDEVNFALDGLKGGQPVRIRRASLLTLLSICGTVQQRRHLNIHGMAKTIIDAVLGLTFDDMPSNLAAAALVYILTIDGQDDHLRDSPNCIRFLIKMLKPLSSSVVKEKALPIGSKLLSLCKNVGFLQESAKGTDSSSTAIMLKVQEILVSCKEMKPRDDIDGGIEEPELNPKWISLLTMEKACSSRISVEDTSGLRKTGGKFKEKLREFGGLDAVFEVARKCHSVMEEWVEKSPTFSLDSREILGLESLVLLLKCLKIMENALFLSNDNQRHLLGMKGNFDGQRAPRSFTKLVLSVIKILSGVSLLRSSSTSSQDEKRGCISYGMELTSQESFAQCDLGIKPSVGPTQGSVDELLLKLRAESSHSGLCSGASRNSDHSEDPFVFGDDEFEPSKWDLLPGSSNTSLSQDSGAAGSQYRYESQSVPLSSQQESNDVECRHTQGTASCSSAVDEDKPNLLADCLLTAVKVLMNLTNDNPEGCRQIATCGGLEILSSLIAGHFSSFSTLIDSRFSSKASSKIDQRSNTHLTDRQMDFLVALLGLLVNLVEKDSRNRSRLAAATVSLPNMEGSDSEDQSDVISLLCSIFLANQGNEASGEETYLSLEDEDSILQGEKEAEKMIVEAYAALLLAFLSTERSKRTQCHCRMSSESQLEDTCSGVGEISGISYDAERDITGDAHSCS
ncbi:hypothetical protein CASFOL_031578 [Castilleja foliolosa]|uniref:Wings apart-like protein C-terminal domain-containing protein n=1 Tax=Castilleja foliolosa TaxID=1961234 RepID=A0ABD3C7V2_9LAMI